MAALRKFGSQDLQFCGFGLSSVLSLMRLILTNTFSFLISYSMNILRSPCITDNLQNDTLSLVIQLIFILEL